MATSSSGSLGILRLVACVAVVGFLVYRFTLPKHPEPQADPPRIAFKPRQALDPTGYYFVLAQVTPWKPEASLEDIAQTWRELGHKLMPRLDEQIADPEMPAVDRIRGLILKAGLFHYEGEPEKAAALLDEMRGLCRDDAAAAEKWLYTVVYFQGVTALRRGETENCVRCRGDSSCILPLSPSARHTNRTGSQNAVKYFSEYLDLFPDDLEVQWLLNIAYMTLGEYPDGIAPRRRVALDRYNTAEHGIGKFRDIGHLVGVNRLNMAGGTIMDDFDNDGLLDLVFTSMDPSASMAFYRNKGDGTFEDRSQAAGVLGQIGGLNCVQADYNNDGHMDIFIGRGAWLAHPMRPTLLKNNGNGTFTDVTKEAGLVHAMNTDTMQWADFDNDGWLDLLVCGETGPSRLYRNNGNGTFEDVAAKAGLGDLPGMWKGCSWFDYDNDGFPDLFLNNFTGTARLFHNNRNKTFTETTEAMGIKGPTKGLSCWTWDYDNDGWPDIFATCYDRSLGDVVNGLLGKPHGRDTSRLYRNLGGKGFQDVTREVGLEQCLSSMGTNFADFDNDGFLDCYLGTGDHDIATLVPNRMFRNLGGKRFADITASSGTGHLQKGHGVACGDWDRDGNVDIAIEMGGAIPGDKYHNILFQNPGQGNRWLNVKLVGTKTNRCAIGARIKAVTAGANPQTVYRHVASGSSFGANPLEQMIGLGQADRIAVLEIYWPTSGTTQTFRDVAANQAIEITEFATDFRKREFKPIPVPK